MSENQIEFIQEFKKQSIGLFMGAIVAILITAITFYYTTAANIEKITIEQQSIKTRQSAMETFIFDMNEKKINKNDYIREVDEIKMILRNMDSKIDLLK